MATLKAGGRMQSSVCSTEVMIVKAPAEADLTCGGAELIPLGQEKSSASPAEGHDGGTQIGKRYVDADETLEVLCTKPGKGALAVGGTLLTIKGAKPLPSSD